MYINGYDCFVSFIALQCLIERPAIGVYVRIDNYYSKFRYVHEDKWNIMFDKSVDWHKRVVYLLAYLNQQ